MLFTVFRGMAKDLPDRRVWYIWIVFLFWIVENGKKINLNENYKMEVEIFLQLGLYYIPENNGNNFILHLEDSLEFFSASLSDVY